MTSGPIEKMPDQREDRILIVQSAEPAFVLKALERLGEKPLFHNPRYTLFCRNLPDILESFRDHPMLDRVLLHSETRHCWKHLRNLRSRRFDAAIMFMTGERSYWKVKFYTFLLGVPLGRILVFNENIDCFFFNWNQWLGLLSYRMRKGLNPGIGEKHAHSAYTVISSTTKIALLPFRFLWLLWVWSRLRLSGMNSSRKNHDYPLQLPPSPGA
jgi:hypothetical protein